MKRLAVVILHIGLMLALTDLSSWAQSSSSGAQAAPSGSTGRSTSGSANSTRPPNTQTRSPSFVTGQVISENGLKIRDSISARLACGTRTLQTIHADLNGMFQFTLGSGAQSNMEITAADDSQLSVATSAGPSPIGGFGTILGNSGVDLSGTSLTGCEINVSVSGFEPARRMITNSISFGTVDVGVLILKPIGAVEEDTIRATSVLAPGSARKEFEKGVKDLQQNRTDSAARHMEKAVSQYDQFAVAWYELGKLYTTTDSAKARHAFEKAIAADDHFVDPYVHLAALKLDAQDNLGAIQTAAGALAIQPLNKLANFIHAAGNFNLDHLDQAEKSARLAAMTTKGYLPQLHALLASILLKKEDYPNAILEMNSYLEEAPLGPFASQIKRNLERLRNSEVHNGGDPSSVSEHP